MFVFYQKNQTQIGDKFNIIHNSFNSRKTLKQNKCVIYISNVITEELAEPIAV